MIIFVKYFTDFLPRTETVARLPSSVSPPWPPWPSPLPPPPSHWPLMAATMVTMVNGHDHANFKVVPHETLIIPIPVTTSDVHFPESISLTLLAANRASCAFGQLLASLLIRLYL